MDVRNDCILHQTIDMLYRVKERGRGVGLSIDLSSPLDTNQCRHIQRDKPSMMTREKKERHLSSYSVRERERERENLQSNNKIQPCL